MNRRCLDHPFEMNIEKSRDYKKTKCKNLRSALLSAHAYFNLILLDILTVYWINGII